MKKIQLGHHHKKKYKNPIMYALVDDEDYERVGQFKWFAMKTGRDYIYAIRSKGKGTVCMHRFIMNTPKDMQTDHINGDTLDNRRSNLRICTKGENLQNQRVRRDNKSGYKGVVFLKSANMYRAQIKKNGKVFYFGQFKEPREAAVAYNDAAKKLHGEFAYLNEI
jgi:hypothetical protein